ncbi:MAG TPA: hypothetical protein VMH49_05125 [Thermoplasmata archaeon]|nr:hypothetical protein [Thermoplasmata archaeon]
MARGVRTFLRPPRLASLERAREQLASSSRSTVFVQDGERLLRAWGPPERPFALAVEPSSDRWAVEAYGVGPVAARRAVRELFSLEDDLGAFYRRVRNEPVLRGTERRFRGLRLPRDANLYEALLHAIVGQQLSVASANAITRRLVARFGRSLDAGGIDVPVLPAPDELVSAGASGLRSVGLSRAKARALLGVGAWSSRAPTLGQLRRASADDARAELERLPGVGPWSAENALLRGAGRTDIFVAGDLGVRVALERFGAVAREAPESDARAWAARHYAGWGSYATLYLWRRLVTEVAARAG